MATFRDNTGREWVVTVTVDTVKRVRAACGVDLLCLGEQNVLARMSSDPALLCDVLFLASVPANGEAVSGVDFGRAMAGDAIDEAARAFLEELVRFFPSRQRPILAEVLKKVEAAEAAATGILLRRVQDLNPEELAKQAVALTGSGSSSTEQPEPAA